MSAFSEADLDQLYEVFGMEPVAEMALVEGQVTKVTNAQARDAEAVFVDVHRSESLAEGLRYAVTTVGAATFSSVPM